MAYSEVLSIVRFVRGLRPLLFQKIDTRITGIKVMRLRLNRHLQEVDSLEEHKHGWSQLLCYLSGSGALEFGAREYSISRGTVVWVPKGQIHGFREMRGRRPLCLAIDLLFTPHQKLTAIAKLNQSDMSKIRHSLAEMSRLGIPETLESRLTASTQTLAILDTMFRALGFLPRHTAAVPNFVKKFRGIVAKPESSGLSIREIAARLGYQPDYLNRAFKRSTGLSLSEQRNAIRLETAKAALIKGASSSKAAEVSGFDDTNYFSRWFKMQTGMKPTEFAALNKK